MLVSRPLARLNILLQRKFLSSSSNMPQWTHLIRFRSHDDQIHYGQPVLPNNDWSAADFTPSKANLIEGDIFSPTSTVTNKIVEVKKLLAPVEPPIFRCIGLNYKNHAKETNAAIPKYPIIFIKPAASVQNPHDPILIPKVCQDDQTDYEAELAVVIGKECKNVDKSEALNYVLGYMVANDVSARRWQGTKMGEAKLGATQWCFSKGFDTFCPVGPMLVSQEFIKDPNNLRIGCKLNGQVMQDSNTRDMIFDIPSLISFLSQGTTLRPGDVIVTGTPEGVGFTRQPPVWLRDGDVVDVFIEKLGVLRNKVVFDGKSKAKL